MRELLATSVILGMCAGRWGRNGSSLRRIRSPNFANSRCRRDRSLTSAMIFAGTPKYWSVPRGIWAKKNPIARPTDCYLDCERRRYFEKIANTLAFWRQKRQKPLNSYGFFIHFAPRTGICSGIGSWRGSRTAPRASPQTFPSQSNSGGHCPLQNQWKPMKNRWKPMKTVENRWKSINLDKKLKNNHKTIQYRFKYQCDILKIVKNQYKLMEIETKPMNIVYKKFKSHKN